MGGDWHSGVREFESLHRLLDGHFKHFIVVRKLYCLFEKTKNKWKRGQGWPIFKKKAFWKSFEYKGQWLWLSWQSGCFQYQRSAVQIQSSAKFIEQLYTVNCIEKTKIKIKRPGMAHLKNLLNILTGGIRYLAIPTSQYYIFSSQFLLILAKMNKFQI